VRVTTALPEEIVEDVLSFPEWHAGVHRVTVALDDGRRFRGVLVSWGTDVLSVEGYGAVPFDATDVVAVEDDSTR
jgi:hypothetical protein